VRESRRQLPVAVLVRTRLQQTAQELLEAFAAPGTPAPMTF